MTITVQTNSYSQQPKLLVTAASKTPLRSHWRQIRNGKKPTGCYNTTHTISSQTATPRKTSENHLLLASLHCSFLLCHSGLATLTIHDVPSDLCPVVTSWMSQWCHVHIYPLIHCCFEGFLTEEISIYISVQCLDGSITFLTSYIVVPPQELLIQCISICLMVSSLHRNSNEHWLFQNCFICNRIRALSTMDIKWKH